MADRTVRVRLEAAVAGYKAAMASASDTTNKLGRDFTGMARNNREAMSTVGAAATGMGAAMAAGLVVATNAAMDFESSFAGVRKTVDGTDAELAALSDGFRQMATDIPVTVNELNGIGESAGQLGIAKDNILDFSRVMADLGVATNLSSEQAATSLARLANITQMSQDDFDRLGSVIVDLGNNLETTEAEVVEMGLRIAGAGTQIGFTEGEILGLAGALSSVGIQAEAGGSAISKVMIDIASEVANSGEKLGDFARVAGMTSEQFAVAWREDAAGALVAFIEGLGNMEAQGGSTLQVLEELGITEVRMRDALLRTSAAGDKVRQAVELGNDAWAENNALTQEAAQRYETAESRIQIAKNKLNDAAIEIGQNTLPVVAGMAEAVGNAAEKFAALPDPVQRAATGVGAVGAAAGLAGGAFLLMAPRIIDVADALGQTERAGSLARGALRGVAKAAAFAGVLYATGEAAGFLEGKLRDLTMGPRAGIDDLTDSLKDVARIGGLGDDIDADELVRQFTRINGGVDGLTAAFGNWWDAITDPDGDEAVKQIEDVDRAVEGFINTDPARGAKALVQLREELSAAGMSADEIATMLPRATQGLKDMIREAELAGDLELAAELAAIATGTEDYHLQQRILIGMQREGKISTEELDAAMRELEGQTEETTEDVESFADVMDRLVGVQIDAEEASLRWKNLMADLSEEIGDNATTLDDNTQAGRDNRQSIIDRIKAGQEIARTMVEEEATAGEVTAAMKAHRDELVDGFVQLGFNREAVEKFVDEMGFIPEKIYTEFSTNAPDALLDIQGVRAAIDGIPSSKSFRLNVSGTSMKMPSWMTQQRFFAPRFHSGGTVEHSTSSRALGASMGLRSDEVPAVLQTGEQVIARGGDGGSAGVAVSGQPIVFNLPNGQSARAVLVDGGQAVDAIRQWERSNGPAPIGRR